MSEQSWMDEYFPRTAQEAALGTWFDAAQHSLAKWIGLRDQSLRKHGLSSPPIFVESGSCALCVKSYGCGCDICPLFEVRGGAACDEVRSEEEESPWALYKSDCSCNPEPMIEWLEKTVEYCKKEKI